MIQPLQEGGYCTFTAQGKIFSHWDIDKKVKEHLGLFEKSKVVAVD